jgi:hypothetical protein
MTAPFLYWDFTCGRYLLLQAVRFHFGLAQLRRSDERSFQLGPIQEALAPIRAEQVGSCQVGTTEIGFPQI